MQDFSHLGPFDGDLLNVVIETPKGSRSKFDFGPAQGLFVFSGVPTPGAVFPFDCGLVPATRG